MSAAARRLLFVIGTAAFVWGLLPHTGFRRSLDLLQSSPGAFAPWLPLITFLGHVAAFVGLLVFRIAAFRALIGGLALVCIGFTGEHYARSFDAYLALRAAENLGLFVYSASVLSLTVEQLPRRWLLLGPLLILVCGRVGTYLSGVTFDVLVPPHARPSVAIIVQFILAIGIVAMLWTSAQTPSIPVPERRLDRRIGTHLLTLVALITAGEFFFQILAWPLDQWPTRTLQGIPRELLRFGLYVLTPALLLGALLWKEAGLGRATRLTAASLLIVLGLGWSVLPFRDWASALYAPLLSLLIMEVALHLASRSPDSARVAVAFLPTLVSQTVAIGTLQLSLPLFAGSGEVPTGHPFKATAALILLLVATTALLIFPRTGRAKRDLPPTVAIGS